MANVIDLFAGPGGLAEGFSSLFANGIRKFDVRLSIEKDSVPYQTLKLRAFFRTFAPEHAPDEYYEFLAGLIKLEALYDAYPRRSAEAESEALQATLGKCSHDWLDTKITEAIDGDPNWVLIGGPPCQAYSLAGIVGNRTNKDYNQETDPRFFLYEEYLRVVALHAPALFVMENVKGLLMARHDGQRIARKVIGGLECPAEFMWRRYSQLVDTPRYRLFTLSGEEISSENDYNSFLVHCEQYGLPQARHRVIIIGIREDIDPSPLTPPESQPSTAVMDVIGDLQQLRSQVSRQRDSLELWRDNLLAINQCEWFTDAVKMHGDKLKHEILTALNQVERSALNIGASWMETVSIPRWNLGWYFDNRMRGTSLHQSRPHILPDLQRYLFCSCFGRAFGRSPKIADFPEQILPKHGNAKSGHFKDRFRVQLPNKPASTIISHLNKDGHAFIHPDPSQCRSLTPREAARIQTFPDNYYFFGGRSHQYRQIGNAVPPLLARVIAEAISPLIPS